MYDILIPSGTFLVIAATDLTMSCVTAGTTCMAKTGALEEQQEEEEDDEQEEEDESVSEEEDSPSSNMTSLLVNNLHQGAPSFESKLKMRD